MWTLVAANADGFIELAFALFCGMVVMIIMRTDR